MLKKALSITLLLILVVLVSGCDRAKGRGKSRKPMNVVFVVMDATRADHLGCYGYPKNTSPNIDALAKNSAVFELAFTHTPWTMPSMASMLTSLHPLDHGVQGWKDHLDDKHLTLAEAFKSHGYTTWASVSHTILVPEYGYGQGFDTYDISLMDKGYPLDIVSSDHITNFGIKAINRSKKKPFFLFLHYFDPHKTYLPHKKFNFGASRIGKYDSEIAYTDHHIGRLLNHLKKKRLWKNTIVVVTADHGEEFREHGNFWHGWKIYDEIVRVPLIIRQPGMKAHRVVEPVTNSDIAPTLLALVGLPVPEAFKGQTIQYDNRFLPQPDRPIFFETYFMDEVCKHGIRKNQWMLIHDCDQQTWELYDTQSDPAQRQNRIETSPEVVGELKPQLLEFYKSQPTKPEKKELSDELKNQLKSVGYL